MLMWHVSHYCPRVRYLVKINEGLAFAKRAKVRGQNRKFVNVMGPKVDLGEISTYYIRMLTL
jgi:hypothetical protein